ncbi:MAG: transglutaminase-like domain-containing protein [Candidatus Korobacteraceae bacterium]
MRRLFLVLFLLICAAYTTFAQSSPSADAKESFSPSERKFAFTYSFTLKNLPAGAKLVRIWIPVPPNDKHQSATMTRIDAPVGSRLGKDAEYGNHIRYFEIANPGAREYKFTVVYDVTRHELSRGDFAQLERKDTPPGVVPASMTRFVEPDKLIPTDGVIQELAQKVTGNDKGTVAKAHAAYEYLFTTMKYDKSGTGWGRGDAVWACDAKHGNCTDFHSPFIGMLRADKIPARFDIGFPLPEGKDQGDIPGYHCWDEFYSSNIGWIPVDISEAWKAKQKENYFFGSIDANRVQFSTGRDITLVPKQDGLPLNYFVYPYVEVDGKPYDKIDKSFSFVEKKSPERNHAALRSLPAGK